MKLQLLNNIFIVDYYHIINNANHVNNIYNVNNTHNNEIHTNINTYYSNNSVYMCNVDKCSVNNKLIYAANSVCYIYIFIVDIRVFFFMLCAHRCIYVYMHIYV